MERAVIIDIKDQARNGNQPKVSLTAELPKELVLQNYVGKTLSLRTQPTMTEKQINQTLLMQPPNGHRCNYHLLPMKCNGLVTDILLSDGPHCCKYNIAQDAWSCMKVNVGSIKHLQTHPPELTVQFSDRQFIALDLWHDGSGYQLISMVNQDNELAQWNKLPNIALCTKLDILNNAFTFEDKLVIFARQVGRRSVFLVLQLVVEDDEIVGIEEGYDVIELDVRCNTEVRAQPRVAWSGRDLVVRIPQYQSDQYDPFDQIQLLEFYIPNADLSSQNLNMTAGLQKFITFDLAISD